MESLASGGFCSARALKAIGTMWILGGFGLCLCIDHCLKETAIVLKPMRVLDIRVIKSACPSSLGDEAAIHTLELPRSTRSRDVILAD